MRLRLFQFSLRDQASNWLEWPSSRIHHHMGGSYYDSIAQFFHRDLGTIKISQRIYLTVQQHHGESLSEAWTRFKGLTPKSFPHLMASDCWLQSKFLGPSPQPQALGTTFEARELTTSRTPKKVLIREETKFLVTKNVNSISLARNEEEENNKTDETPDNTKMPTEKEMPVRKAEAMNGAENGARNESIKTPKNDEVVDVTGSQPVAYYLKHKINEKLIKGLGDVYDAILKNKITKNEDIRGNFEIPCSIGGLKDANALVDQGFDVNVMPYSTYMKLTDKRPAEIDIRLSLASHSYIYPLGIDEDVFVEVAEHVYPVDFVILDIKENEKRPIILGTPFLKTAKATSRFDKGTITLRSRKSKVEFFEGWKPLSPLQLAVEEVMSE
ncbi:zinc finger, CCHC-type containing protein [Tanacetum coccineum]